MYVGSLRAILYNEGSAAVVVARLFERGIWMHYREVVLLPATLPHCAPRNQSVLDDTLEGLIVNTSLCCVVEVLGVFGGHWHFSSIGLHHNPA